MVCSDVVQYQHPEEWQLWKTEHGKSYESQREELERHLVWLANREYINAHNKNAHVLGFTLAMNHLGDIVRVKCFIMWIVGVGGLITLAFSNILTLSSPVYQVETLYLALYLYE